MNTQQSIITLTVNPALDKSTSVDRVAPEIKMRCEPLAFDPGGGGINVSRAILRLRGESQAYYLAGGMSGAMFQKLLDDEGLDHHAVLIEGMTRESFTAYDRSTTLQFRFNVPGPEVHESEWREVLHRLEMLDPAPAYLVASGSLPPGIPNEFYGYVAQIAAKRGTKLILDTSGEALQQSAHYGVYLLKPNLRELNQLAGQDFEDDQHIDESARQLIAKGYAEVIVVSLGAGGARLVTAEMSQHVRAPTVPIRSKVGAGDTMVAGIVLSLARGWALIDAVRYGVVAGAATVMTDGTQLCRVEDVERLYKQMSAEAAS